MDFKKTNFTGNRKDQNPFSRQDKRNFWEFISDNKKIVMPVVLILAVALTVGIALNANKRDKSVSGDNDIFTNINEDGSYVIPEVDLEKNAYEDVNALMKTYFDAYATGDMDTIKSIYVGLESTEELRLQEVSQYITGVPTIDVYTKPGPVDGSYVAYAYTEVLFQGYDTPLPGMQTMYVCTDDTGKLYINGDVVDDRVTEYISNISLQADVVDLNNKVAAQYNDIIAANEELATFLSDMSANIQVSVGEALAAIESGEQLPASADAGAEGSDEAAEQTTEAGEEQEQPANTRKIKAIDAVNVRSSDSETADRIGQIATGDVCTELEALGNGWSKIEYQGGTAYVKSEFFEEVVENDDSAANEASSEETAAEDTADAEETTLQETAAEEIPTEETPTEETDQAAEETSSTSSGVDIYAKGKMTVSETVRLRKAQSTEAESLANIYPGEKINVVEQYANGWAKVEYNGDTGYIKSEYLMK